VTHPNDFEARLDTYVDLLLRLGLNLQRGQVLVIRSREPMPVDDLAPFARRVAARAYALGARDVHVLWNDADVARTRLAHAPEAALDDVAAWQVRGLEGLGRAGAAFLMPSAPDPDLYADIAPERITRAQTATRRAYDRLATNQLKMRYPWLIAGVATRAWAHKAFPHLDATDGLRALWDYIFATTRVDAADPLAAWREHLGRLQARASFLNRAHFRALRYRAPDTDLTIELPDGHIWVGAGGAGPNKVPFVPNMPTEEVFTLPRRGGVHGQVRSSMPLNYNGSLIRGLHLSLEGGRIVGYGADEGEDVLKGIVETDDGSHHLGEVALVTHDSPVNIGRPVFNTLFDENAACHLAIGRAIPVCLKGGERMSAADLAAHGANVSLMHVDFMVGSDQLDIDGETASGERVPVLRRGMWAGGAAASV
jgi:aminopeptidase